MAGTWKSHLLLVIAAVAASGAGSAEASIMWQAVGVKSDMGQSSSSLPLINVINQSGLVTPYISGVTDAAAYNSPHDGSSNEWYSARNKTTGVVSFDLGTSLSLSGYRLWNTTWGGQGGPFDIREFELYADDDYDTGDDLGSLLGSFTAQETQATHPMQSFDFSETSTRYVHMKILSNYGGTSYTGFAEAAFVTGSGGVAAVPEPSTWIGWSLLGLCGVVYGMYRRRKDAVSLNQPV